MLSCLSLPHFVNWEVNTKLLLSLDLFISEAVPRSPGGFQGSEGDH